MDIRILGPLEATENGRSIAPTAAKPRTILALLAVNRGGVVGVPELIDELWGAEPPRSALTTIQTYVMRLRRLIEAASDHADDRTGAKDVLVHRLGGYLLDVDPDDLDAGRYERLAAAGARAFDLGDLPSASRLLGSALDEWRGPALADLEHGMPLGLEVTRLEESRLDTVETRLEAELGLGRHRSLLGELAVLRARHPMNENLCAIRMLALYRSGRRWEALEAYRALHLTLADELGVGPSARLQRLHRSILDADTALDATRHREVIEVARRG